MTIYMRQATKEDAKQIAPLIYEAIGDIAHRLTGETRDQAVLATLEKMIQDENNRHSYQYTFVAQDENLLGIAVLYDGKQGKELDALWMKELQTKGQLVAIDVEAHDDEYYIDTVCVTPNARGKGIGTRLLQFAEQQGRTLGYQKLSLNVEKDKEKARKLYVTQGFTITEPWTIIGEKFDHMVKEL